MGTATTTEMPSVRTIKDAVGPIRWAIIVDTGRPVKIDLPKSP